MDGTIAGTSIRRETGDNDEVIRVGHLLSLMGYTVPGPDDGEQERLVDPVFVGFTLSAYLAWRDIEERRDSILPHLPKLLEGCDFHWTLEARDTQLSPRVAVNELLSAAKPLWGSVQQQQEQQPEEEEGMDMTTESIDSGKTSLVIIPATEEEKEEDDDNIQNPDPKRSLAKPTAAYQYPAPFAIAGNLFSSITQSVTTLASGLEIPQISGTATSMGLEGSDMFARTIPTNAQDAKAVMTYYASLGVARLASVFINEPYGIQFNKALQEEAHNAGIALVFFAIERDTIDESMQALKDSQAKYVFAIILEGDWRDVVTSAYDHQVIGHPDYSWMVPDLTYLLDPSFGLDRKTESNIARAMHGLGMINLHMVSADQELFNRAFAQLSHDPIQQQDLISKTPYPEHFSNFSFYDVVPPFLYHYLVYDSVIALGLAACGTEGLFTGPEFFASLLQTSFDGLSGPVSFNNRTGTRTALSTKYQISNILLSDSRSTIVEYKFDVSSSAMIKGDHVAVQFPFVYNNNSTVPPPAMPLLQHHYNLIPQSLQVVGLCMGGLVMLLSLFFMGWTAGNRKKFIVASGQPLFLIQLCLGTMIMSSAIIPLSMQGETPTNQLDRACMSIPWLLFLGFVVAVSAVLSKTWRLQKIMAGAENMQRIKVEVRNVIKPFIVLLVWNLIMLSGWTFVSPFQYQRVPIHNYDSYGRNTESFGRCQCPNNWVYLFAGLASAANCCGVLFACYVCYKVRNVTVYFSETSYLSASMISLLETALIGGPMLLAARDNPSAFFLVSSGLTCITSLAFLLPIFAFKVGRKHTTYRDAKADDQRRKDMDSLGLGSSSRHSRMVDPTLPKRIGKMSIRRNDSSIASSNTHLNGLSSHHSRTSHTSHPNGLSSHHSARRKENDHRHHQQRHCPSCVSEASFA